MNRFIQRFLSPHFSLKQGLRSLARALAIVLCFSLIHCDKEDDDVAKGGCPWNGNCSGMAPEGAYDCSGNSIVKCVGGKWDHVQLCSSTEDSDGYSCTCKGGCGVDKTECSFAFEVCEGHSYETCGPNANAGIVNGKWDCI